MVTPKYSHRFKKKKKRAWFHTKAFRLALNPQGRVQVLLAGPDWALVTSVPGSLVFFS